MVTGRLTFLDYSHSYRLPGFQPVEAIKKVTIRDVLPGEIVCITGANGSGKTTFLLAVLGLLPQNAEHGSILLEDHLVQRNSLRMSFIPQRPHEGLVFDLSVLENIALRRLSFSWPCFRRVTSGRRYKEIQLLLEELGFRFLVGKLGMPPSALSGGQQQALNAIGAIYAEPDVIVSDEPVSKLDEANKIRVCQLLVQAAHLRGARVLFSSHDLDLAHRMADRIVHLSDGIVEREEILRKPLSSRRFPAVRLAETEGDLPHELQHVNPGWWMPGKDSLFGDAYLHGDDSAEGSLASVSLTRNERTLREVDAVIHLTNCSANAVTHIVDVPCGWGRHSIELARRGYRVTGVDLSEQYIGMASQQATEQRLSTAEFLNGDMRKIPLPDACADLVLNLWTSFGFFGPPEDFLALKEIARILRPRGYFLVHSDHSPRRVCQGIFDEPEIRHPRRGGLLTVTEWFCKQDLFVYGLWKLQGTDSSEHAYRIRPYAVAEWELMANQVGMKVTRILGSLDGAASTLSDRSQEFVLLIQKQ